MLQDVIKYIAVTDKRVLCAKGWRLKSNLDDCQIKLFPNPSHVHHYFDDRRYAKPKFHIQKVRVIIEVIEDVISKELED